MQRLLVFASGSLRGRDEHAGKMMHDSGRFGANVAALSEKPRAGGSIELKIREASSRMRIRARSTGATVYKVS